MMCQYCGGTVLSDYEENTCINCGREHSNNGELVVTIPAPKITSTGGRPGMKQTMVKRKRVNHHQRNKYSDKKEKT